jgi:integrase
VRQILTDASCKTKPPHGGRLEIADLRQVGLVLRITSKGARSFAFRFRHPDTRKTLRATIGSYPSTSLEAARKRARDMAAQVEGGVNPIEARRVERASAPTRTFEALANRYLNEHAKRHKRPRSAEEDERNLKVHVLPKWGKRDFRNIRRADAIELIEGIISTGRHTCANRVHGLISKIFSFAIDSDLLEANPVSRLKKRGVERVGTRVLDDDELRQFWHGIVRKPVSRQVGLALRLALLTAARASEVTGARKGEFEDLDRQATWTIPGQRVKNGQDHLVPLSPLAVETVRAAMAMTNEADEYLFPSRLSHGEPIDRHALTTAMRRFGEDQQIKERPSPHDLRRTVNTRMAKMEVPKEVRDKVLNHTRRSDPEGRSYNKHDYRGEKAAAFSRWAEEIKRITNATPVVPKRRR